MSSSRKARTASKQCSNLNEVSPDKDIASSKGGRPGKMKLSDMLGPQWSHEELKHFYEGYRKHGRDWRRVAGALHNRSVEMVEALYNMNRAYLSLPEGMASVVGLRAMMTDHYNVLEGSDDSDQENFDAAEMKKQQKRKRAKVQLTAPTEDLLHSSNSLSNDGCLSLLKRRRIGDGEPRAVGKRTPRIPVSSLYRRDGRENFVSLNKRHGKSEGDDDAHEAALALAVASHKGVSPQVSQSPSNGTNYMKPSPVQIWERMNSQSGATKCGVESSDEDLVDGSMGSLETENGGFAKATRSLQDIEGVGTAEVHRKGKKIYRKKAKLEEGKRSEDGGEACSRNGKGDNAIALKREVDLEALNVKKGKSVRQGQRKRSKKLFCGDESAALSALQTLADLSLMMPASALDSESSVQLKEETTSFDLDNKSDAPEAMSSAHQRGSPQGSKDKMNHAMSRSGKKLKLGRMETLDASSQMNEKLKPPKKTGKRKSKLVVPEAAGEEGNKSAIKGKGTDSKIHKLSKSSFDADQRGRKTGCVTTSQVTPPPQFDLATRYRSRRKKNLRNIWSSKESSGSSTISRKRRDKQATYVKNKAILLKEKLYSCLSSSLARRWCIFEWFYSAIDHQWFARRDFVEYLNHVGLGHVQKLTRVEWSFIRSSLGKPRRFSENFLREERTKLEQYRETVRKHYAELRSGATDGLRADIARPLSVGQRVIALHPKTRELHDGSVLMVGHDKCMIHFYLADAGVEFVMDVDCMPFNPADDMPEAFRKQCGFAEKFSMISKETKTNGNINFGVSLDGAQQLVYGQSLPATQAREADILSLSNITWVSNKQASSAAVQLRKQNTSTSHPRPWLTPHANSSNLNGLSGSVDTYSLSQESGCNILEIIDGSRLKAHVMVDTAIKAISSVKEERDAFRRIQAAFDSTSDQDQRFLAATSSEKASGGTHQPHQLSDGTMEPSGSGPSGYSDKKETHHIPADLITSCVATSLMIQTCTERHYPPADVARMLDSAVSSLRPLCPENLSVYREIQMSMGRLKTQILALVPTQI